eukprot:11401_1
MSSLSYETRERGSAFLFFPNNSVNMISFLNLLWGILVLDAGVAGEDLASLVVLDGLLEVNHPGLADLEVVGVLGAKQHRDLGGVANVDVTLGLLDRLGGLGGGALGLEVEGLGGLGGTEAPHANLADGDVWVLGSDPPELHGGEVGHQRQTAGSDLLLGQVGEDVLLLGLLGHQELVDHVDGVALDALDPPSGELAALAQGHGLTALDPLVVVLGQGGEGVDLAVLGGGPVDVGAVDLLGDLGVRLVLEVVGGVGHVDVLAVDAVDEGGGLEALGVGNDGLVLVGGGIHRGDGAVHGLEVGLGLILEVLAVLGLEVAQLALVGLVLGLAGLLDWILVALLLLLLLGGLATLGKLALASTGNAGHAAVHGVDAGGEGRGQDLGLGAGLLAASLDGAVKHLLEDALHLGHGGVGDLGALLGHLLLGGGLGLVGQTHGAGELALLLLPVAVLGLDVQHRVDGGPGLQVLHRHAGLLEDLHVVGDLGSGLQVGHGVDVPLDLVVRALGAVRVLLLLLHVLLEVGHQLVLGLVVLGVVLVDLAGDLEGLLAGEAGGVAALGVLHGVAGAGDHLDPVHAAVG